MCKCYWFVDHVTSPKRLQGDLMLVPLFRTAEIYSAGDLPVFEVYEPKWYSFKI